MWHISQGGEGRRALRRRGSRGIFHGLSPPCSGAVLGSGWGPRNLGSCSALEKVAQGRVPREGSQLRPHQEVSTGFLSSPVSPNTGAWSRWGPKLGRDGFESGSCQPVHIPVLRLRTWQFQPSWLHLKSRMGEGGGRGSRKEETPPSPREPNCDGKSGPALGTWV